MSPVITLRGSFSQASPEPSRTLLQKSIRDTDMAQALIGGRWGFYFMSVYIIRYVLSVTVTNRALT